MGIKIGVAGAGRFGGSFIPLFRAHPLVDEVCVAEVVPERRAAAAARFGISRTFASLDELCDTDVDAIALFTQRWMHGPQAVQALEADKHVYSAVPAGISVEEVGALVEAVRRSGRIYMNGETSYYYPSALYCRERFRKGDFGRFVYGEAEYTHDFSHGSYEGYQRSGPEWKRLASFPPMYYPTHTVSMILSVVGGRFTHVSGLGQVDHEDDGIFSKETSAWGNDFSNESALFRTSGGGMARINEFRRVGMPAGNAVRTSIYGTLGAYEEQWNARAWCSRDARRAEDLTDLLTCKPIAATREERRDIPDALREDFFMGLSEVHPVHRLPQTFAGQPNGHYGSHQFLVCDFVEACTSGKQPTLNVWLAARFCLPGIIAHQSAQRGGEQLEIPDFGEPPLS
jgi:predicted dehydrogenase